MYSVLCQLLGQNALLFVGVCAFGRESLALVDAFLGTELRLTLSQI